MWSLIWLQSPASCFFFTIDVLCDFLRFFFESCFRFGIYSSDAFVVLEQEEIEDLEVPELEEEIPGPEEDLAVVEPGAHRFPVRIVVRLFVFWVFLDVM